MPCPGAGEGLHAPRWSAARSGFATRVPVLMYHRIAEDGPEALAPWRIHPAAFEEQLQFLREQGYHSITSGQLRSTLATKQPIAGKPVLLTFDDGCLDFFELAWPLLEKYGFRAEVFVVTDKVGTSADWDSQYGPPAPLMGWRELTSLQAQGIAIGSHLASHRPANTLSRDELAQEALRSRFTLEARLRVRVASVAMPFGVWDGRLLAALQWARYEIGFTTEDRAAELGSHPLTVPRLHVVGGQDMTSFARRIVEATAGGLGCLP